MISRYTELMKFALVTAFATIGGITHAAQPLMTDDTGTQGEGGNQLEFSYTENQVRQAGSPNTSSHAMPLVYTRGITDTLDAFAQGNEGGTGNPSFGFKWRFYEGPEGSGTSIALKPELRLPLNPKGEAIPDVVRTTGSFTGILTQEVSFGAIQANLFYSEDTTEDKRSTIPAAMGGRLATARTQTIRLAAAPVWNVTEEFKLVAEAGYQQARTSTGTTVTNITEFGLIYSPNKDLDFAAGFTRSEENSAPVKVTNTGTIGVTWRFK